MNILTTTYITRLPELTPRAKELQFAMEFWRMQYAEAGSVKEIAWCKYGEAIEDGEAPEMIEQLFVLAQNADDICRDAWKQWQETKSDYLKLFN